jgi:hypothetical protein
VCASVTRWRGGKRETVSGCVCAPRLLNPVSAFISLCSNPILLSRAEPKLVRRVSSARKSYDDDEDILNGPLGDTPPGGMRESAAALAAAAAVSVHLPLSPRLLPFLSSLPHLCLLPLPHLPNASSLFPLHPHSFSGDPPPGHGGRPKESSSQGWKVLETRQLTKFEQDAMDKAKERHKASIGASKVRTGERIEGQWEREGERAKQTSLPFTDAEHFLNTPFPSLPSPYPSLSLSQSPTPCSPLFSQNSTLPNPHPDHDGSGLFRQRFHIHPDRRHVQGL